MKKLIGIDVGGTTVKIGILDETGELLNHWSIYTDTSNHGKNILPDITNSINQKLVEQNIPKSEILGVGIGVPGPVDNNGILNGAVNLGWTKEVEIEKDLSKLLELPVHADNDANCASLGEMWRGSGLGAQNMIFVTLGTGVGGGIIANGKIIKGNNGGGGEIGHITVDRNDDAFLCNCGKKGCLETLTSATGIVKVAKKHLENYDGDTILRKYSNLNAKNVFDAAKKGDEFALSMLEIFGEYLAMALASISNITNPSTIVIGGGVSKAGSIIIKYIKRHFDQFVFYPNKEIEFKIASLGNNAGVIGAAYLVKM